MGSSLREDTVLGSSEGLTFAPSDGLEAGGGLGELEPLNQKC